MPKRVTSFFLDEIKRYLCFHLLFSLQCQNVRVAFCLIYEMCYISCLLRIFFFFHRSKILYTMKVDPDVQDSFIENVIVDISLVEGRS